MSEKYGFVYLWFDRKHKRYYVGCHWGTEHDGYICSSRWMRQAFKRRPEDFKRRILKRHIEKSNLLDEEFRYLSMIKPEELKVRYYNLHNHRFNHWTYDPTSKLTISQKISAHHKSDPNWGQWAKGKEVSEETREKLRQANLRNTHSEETKQKCRSYRHTKEAKKKISDAGRGRKFSEQSIQKRLNTLEERGYKPKPLTEEHKRNISLGMLGKKRRPHSEETKRKISESKKRKIS